MISVMKGFEIERKPATSVSVTADRVFLVTDNPQEGARVSGGGYSGASSEPRVSSGVNLAEKMADLEARVSGKGEQRGSRSLEEEVKMETDGDDEDRASLAEDSMDSFVESSGWMHGFRVGDMVWGKVKSHPWWPGHIFNDAFASPSVRRMRRDGLVLVAFFGDSSYGWFDPAELIPFESHFSEKSRQTTSRNFVRAVEEAVDEASRRGSLAVACCCRNLNNFRPSTVAGYFAVDVVGYEPGGIYSLRQIKNSRDSFVPAELHSFMQQLALAPRGNDRNSIEWIQRIAKLLAYRRAVFEEFDETYAQAFGVEPVRPSFNSMGVLNQTDRFAPRVAPLSGPLVVAEALGERRTSTRHASQKANNVTKKNKYVLKRREDLPAAASSTLPDLPSASQPLRHGFFPNSLPESSDPPASGVDSNYVLRKREDPPTPPSVATDSSIVWKSRTEASLPPGYSQESEPVEFKIEPGSSVPDIPVESSQVHADCQDQKPPLVVHGGMAAVKSKKVLKRPLEDLNESGEVKKKKKKKKKKDSLGADQTPASLDADHRGLVAELDPELLPQEDGINMEIPPGLELSSLNLPQLVNDLSSIALNPFYDIERHAPAIVRHVFLRFRSLVYQKSLILSAAIEQAVAPQASSADTGASVSREGRGQREPSSSSKPPKPASRLGESTKAVRKREPSDRQEELSVKKMKKMNQLKELASKKKKASSSQKNQETQQQQPKDHKDSASAIATATATATEATRKQELPPSPKLPSPTFLIMKFPPRSILPSAANLKARFARFGPLDPSATRVYWKSYSCKVLFKYKSDAQSAYDFVKNNVLFGQVKVIYYLRDLEVPGPDQPPDTPIRPTDSPLPDKDPLQNPLGSANLQRPSLSQAQQNQTQLKSILKKPGGDESGSNGSAASGVIAKESPRVKFMLNGDDDDRSEPPPPPPKVVPNSGGQPPKSVEFFSPPPSHPPPHPSRGPDMHPHRIPPPLPAALQQTLLPPPQTLPPPPRVLQPRGLLPPLAPPLPNDPRERSNVDISGPMLSLLLKCNDIVSNVKSSLGYTPYHIL